MKSIKEIIEYKEVYDTHIYRYIKKYRHVTKTNTLFLSAKYHYFYDENDLKFIRNIIHLKLLNNISHLDDIIYDISKFLDIGDVFCGKFIASQPTIGSKYKKFFEVLEKFIGEKTNKTLTKKDIISYLKAYDITVMNMEDIDGITYFHAEKL